MNIRVAKYISNSGYCSRRDAEKLILDGKVFVNNTSVIIQVKKLIQKILLK